MPTRIPVSVKRGVAFLDARLPGWRNKVRPETLELSSPCNCVLGQVFGDYDEALGLFGLSDDQAKSFGFFRTSKQQEWGSLTDAWREVLKP